MILRPYQRESAAFIAEEIQASDVTLTFNFIAGAGKTIIIIEVMKILKEDCLLICRYELREQFSKIKKLMNGEFDLTNIRSFKLFEFTNIKYVFLSDIPADKADFCEDFITRANPDIKIKRVNCF